MLRSRHSSSSCAIMFCFLIVVPPPFFPASGDTLIKYLGDVLVFFRNDPTYITLDAPDEYRKSASTTSSRIGPGACQMAD